MSKADEVGLNTIPDEIIDAVAGGDMTDDERAWFLGWAAKYKKKGYTPEYTADTFVTLVHGALHRYDITTQEVTDILAAEWDNLQIS